MPAKQFEIRPGAYFDSVVLMQLQRALADLPGVVDAGVVMATPANRELLAANDLLVNAQAGPDDLLIVIKADTEQAALDALAQVDSLLARRRSSPGIEFRPRSLESAMKQLPEAKWVLVSVPGRFAAGVVREAIQKSLNVFLYSDNVSLEQEVSLKQVASAKGLLLMGPDCGTAIINGVGLGFANRVRVGSIGLVGASGTGLQAIASSIHNLGAGISQAIGTGGRDLSAEVGGVTAIQGLDLLARDPNTEVIVLVSKPPDPEVAARLAAMAQFISKPVVVNFIGYAAPSRRIGNVYYAAGLGDAADLAVTVLGSQRVIESPVNKGPNGVYLRGLFSGGTLAYETLLGLQTTLTPIYSNVPVHETQRLPNATESIAHTILDLGADEFTQGRLHPMMDSDLRLRRLRQEAADSDVGLILLDVVLGQAAHPDPAAELAPVIAQLRDERPLDVVAIIVGTDEDPQNLDLQTERLEAAGAIVFKQVTGAVEYVTNRLLGRTTGIHPTVPLSVLEPGFAAINIGLEIFHDSVVSQGARAVHVDWRPPAGGNERLAAILARMKAAGD